MAKLRFDTKSIPSISVSETGFKEFTATEPPIGSIIVYKTSHVYDEFEPSYTFGRVVSRAVVKHTNVLGVQLHHTFSIDYNGNSTTMFFFKERSHLVSDTFDDLLFHWNTLDALKAWKTTPRATIDYRGLNRLLLSIPRSKGSSKGIPATFHDAVKNFFDGGHYNHHNEVSGLLETHEQAGRCGALFGDIPPHVIDLIARILSGHPHGHLTKSVVDGRRLRDKQPRLR